MKAKSRPVGGPSRRPGAGQRPDPRQTRFGCDRTSSERLFTRAVDRLDHPDFYDEQRFPSGIHRSRRVIDVAIYDGVVEDGVYLSVRARRPRPDWPSTLVLAVRRAAREWGQAA